MAKTYKNLRDEVTSFDNLYSAYEKAAMRNKEDLDYLEFKEHLGVNLFKLQQELRDETHIRGDHKFFPVHDRKKRTAANLPFRDKVVQHAVNNVIEPIFDKVFYPCSYSCRRGKGTHKGVVDVQVTMRRMEKQGLTIKFLKTDFFKFFPSVNLAVLFREIMRKISCKWLLRLLWHLAQNIKGGLIIGDLLSQLQSNIYGHILDRFAKTKLKIRNYFRYADDVVVLHSNSAYLRLIKRKIEVFAKLFMKMKFSKWHIASITKAPLDFLGYRIRPSHKLLRRDSVINAKRKIKKYTARGDTKRLNEFLASWLGHASWADSYNLVKSLKLEVEK